MKKSICTKKGTVRSKEKKFGQPKDKLAIETIKKATATRIAEAREAVRLYKEHINAGKTT